MKKNNLSVKLFIQSFILGVIIIGLTSCGKKDENSPGVEFMPDMYRSVSLEYYSTHTIDGMVENNAKLPVEGTIARGYLPYSYPNTPEGYEKAGLNLKNPLNAKSREEYEVEGEVIYGKFCTHCHGASGAGDGKVSDKLPGPPPAYNGALKNLPEGKIFHSITYGKGTMGSHASQLTQDERWKLVYFVQKLQGPKEVPLADSTAAKVK
ncbi:MAG: cytochrome c [Sphingobacteriaceae bacterium]|nr:cytochrome c [Sphingobacteriaceae bacterium]